MKKTVAFSVILTLLLLCGFNVCAKAEEPQPTPVILEESQENQLLLIGLRFTDERMLRTYKGPPGLDLETAFEDEMNKSGFLYRLSDIAVEEVAVADTRLASQAVTVSHTTESPLPSLQPFIDYSSDGYTGQLKLDTASIRTEPGETMNSSYTLNEDRSFCGLTRNDPYLVPKTVNKNGVALALIGIDWTPHLDGTYTAQAHYSGRASATKVTFFTSAAIYSGEVSRESVKYATYQVVYDKIGTANNNITTIKSEGAPADLSGVVLAVSLLLASLLAAGAAFVLVKYRSVIKVYGEMDGALQYCGQRKVNGPKIELSTIPTPTGCTDFEFVLDRSATRKLKDQGIEVVLWNGTVIPQHVHSNTGKEYRFHTHIEPEEVR